MAPSAVVSVMSGRPEESRGRFHPPVTPPVIVGADVDVDVGDVDIVGVDVDIDVGDVFASPIHKGSRVILPGGAGGDSHADRMYSSSPSSFVLQLYYRV